MKTLRASFLITVATSAVAAPGCGNSVTDVEPTVIVNPPAPSECPDTTPVDGDLCNQPSGLQCTYGECSELTARCNGGLWLVQTASSCNPPPPCPAELPTSGEACLASPGGFPMACTYAVDTPCGEQQAAADCAQDDLGEWVWAVSLPDDCGGADCGAYDDWGTCASDSGCRWLVPGCAEECATCPPAVPEGCYPSDDCVENGCAQGDTCQTVVADPCWDSLCDACGGEVDVCLASG